MGLKPKLLFSKVMHKRLFPKVNSFVYNIYYLSIPLSDQHQLLLDLENRGKNVFYITPEFHTPLSFSNFYLNDTVVQNSAAFKPSAIGSIIDTDNHYVVFREDTAHGYLCSENPVQIKKSSLQEGIKGLLKSEKRKSQKITQEYFFETGKIMLDLLLHQREIPRPLKTYSSQKSFIHNNISGVQVPYYAGKDIKFEKEEKMLSESFRDRMDPLTLKYVARTFFGLELLIVRDDINGAE